MSATMDEMLFEYNRLGDEIDTRKERVTHLRETLAFTAGWNARNDLVGSETTNEKFAEQLAEYMER